MAEEPIPAQPAAPDAAPAAAPAAPAAPVAAPVVEAPKPDAPAAPEAKPADVKPHTDTPTLLEGVKAPEAKAPETKPAEKSPEKPVEAKPGEKPPEAAKPGEKPAEAAAAEKPPEAAAPTVYEIKLPEGIKGEKEVMTSLTTLFGEAKVEPEAAQKIVDIGTKAMLDYRNQLHREQHQTFAETRKDWVKEVMGDPILGGAGHKTAMGAVARMRDLFVPEADQKAFNDFLRVTGAGDHPAFLRMLHNAARYFDEPGLPPANPKPPPNNGRAPGRRGLRDIYAETKSARG